MERVVVFCVHVDGDAFTASTIDGVLYVVRDAKGKYCTAFRNVGDDDRTPLNRNALFAAAERAVRARWQPPQVFSIG